MDQQEIERVYRRCDRFLAHHYPESPAQTLHNLAAHVEHEWILIAVVGAERHRPAETARRRGVERDRQRCRRARRHRARKGRNQAEPIGQHKGRRVQVQRRAPRVRYDERATDALASHRRPEIDAAHAADHFRTGLLIQANFGLVVPDVIFQFSPRESFPADS